VDSDGFIDGRILDAETIEVVHRPVTEKDAVVAVGTWKRKK